MHCARPLRSLVSLAQVQVHTGVKGLELRTAELKNMCLDVDWKHVFLTTATEIRVWNVQSNDVPYWVCCNAVHLEPPSCGHF